MPLIEIQRAICSVLQIERLLILIEQERYPVYVYEITAGLDVYRLITQGVGVRTPFSLGLNKEKKKRESCANREKMRDYFSIHDFLFHVPRILLPELFLHMRCLEGFNTEVFSVAYILCV